MTCSTVSAAGFCSTSRARGYWTNGPAVISTSALLIFPQLCVLLRSFAIVIQQLPIELRDPVCIFYLVLRALDTVEDDMAIPAPEKLPTLISFHDKIYDRCEV